MFTDIRFEITLFYQNEISYQQRKSYLKGTHFVSFWRLMAEENIGGEERGGIKSDTKVHQSQSDDMMGDHLYVCWYSAVHTKQSHKCRNEKKRLPHYSKYKIPSMTSLHYVKKLCFFLTDMAISLKERKLQVTFKFAWNDCFSFILLSKKRMTIFCDDKSTAMLKRKLRTWLPFSSIAFLLGP